MLAALSQSNLLSPVTPRLRQSHRYHLQNTSRILWDVRRGDVGQVVITGNKQLVLPVGLQAGRTYILMVQQGAGGGHTLTFDTRIKWPAGKSPFLSTDAGAMDVFGFVFDGTYLYGVSRYAIPASEAPPISESEPAPADTAQLLNSLISYWKADEALVSSGLVDSYGFNTLPGSNSPGVAAGLINTSRSMNAGFGQEFLFASNPTFVNGNNSFTFSFWFYLTDLSGYYMFIRKSNTSAVGEYCIFLDHVTDQVVFKVYNGTNTASTFVASPAVTANAWHHCIAEFDYENSRIGIDIDQTGMVYQSHTGGCYQSTNDFAVGFIVGRMDEIGYWKRTLNSVEKPLLWNSGTGWPLSSFTN